MLLGALVEYLLLWDPGLPLTTDMRIFTAVLIAGPGCWLVIGSKHALRNADQPLESGKPTIGLGVFRHSRNPLYLGLGLLLFALGVATNFVAWMGSSVLVLIAMHLLLILPEGALPHSKVF